MVRTLKPMAVESRAHLLWSVLAVVPCYDLGANIKAEVNTLMLDKQASLMGL